MKQRRPSPKPPISYEKAVRCLPSFLSHLTNGRPTLMDLQSGVALYGMRVLGLKFQGYEQYTRELPLCELTRETARRAEQLMRWMEMTGAATRQKVKR